MKIDLKNSDIFRGNDNLKVAKKSKKGFMIACLIVGAGIVYGTAGCGEKNNSQAQDSYFEDLTGAVSEIEPINVSLDDINNLNIVINDADCSNTFFTELCQKLEEDGISFTTTNGCQDVNVDNSVVVTLDHQYASGPNTLVLAPYENGRSGNSDALALAMNTGFYENGFFTEGIICGKSGYRETEDGGVMERVPTETEENIGKDNNTSFVTIAFGTQGANVDLVAASIESGLTRYASYVNNIDNYFVDISVDDGDNHYGDLIYRVEDGDTLEKIAEGFSSTTGILNAANDRSRDDTMLLNDQTIVNPKLGEIKEFDNHTPINLYVEKTKWSK